MTKTTIENITKKQIKSLRESAIAHGDYYMADICDRALSDDPNAWDTVDQDGNEIALADWSREEARAECVRVIANGEAQS